MRASHIHMLTHIQSHIPAVAVGLSSHSRVGPLQKTMYTLNQVMVRLYKLGHSLYFHITNMWQCTVQWQGWFKAKQHVERGHTMGSLHSRVQREGGCLQQRVPIALGRCNNTA